MRDGSGDPQSRCPPVDHGAARQIHAGSHPTHSIDCLSPGVMATVKATSLMSHLRKSRLGSPLTNVLCLLMAGASSADSSNILVSLSVTAIVSCLEAYYAQNTSSEWLDFGYGYSFSELKLGRFWTSLCSV